MGQHLFVTLALGSSMACGASAGLQRVSHSAAGIKGCNRILARLTHKPRNGNFQSAGDGDSFVVHDVAGLIFYPGNGCPVQQDALRGELPGQVVLAYGGVAFQAGLPHPCADYVPSRCLDCFFHRVCFPHT